MRDVRFRRSPAALERRVPGGVLVTTPSDPDTRELSGGAAATWVELASPRTMSGLVRRLAARYAVDGGEIAEQVEGCVVELVALGLVEEVRDLDA